MIRVAAIQMTSTADLDVNLRQAELFIQQAAAQGATFILLPENFACYGGDYLDVARTHGDALQAWLTHWARTLGVTLVGGSIPMADRPDGTEVPGGRVRTSCLMFTAQGECIGRYDKLHLFDVQVADGQGRYCESAVFEPGNRLLVRAAGELQVGLMICYDLRFALLARALANAGANLLVYPSAFTEVTGAAHWHLLLRARAVETGCYVLAANQCGQHNDKRCSYGHSLLVNPWGEIVAELENSPGVLLADIDMQRLQQVRDNLPLHQHQRLAVELPDDLCFD